MIEPVMYIGIGFLIAGLLVIGVIPLVHARAVRLTQRRIEAISPMSMVIRDGKDLRGVGFCRWRACTPRCAQARNLPERPLTHCANGNPQFRFP